MRESLRAVTLTGNVIDGENIDSSLKKEDHSVMTFRTSLALSLVVVSLAASVPALLRAEQVGLQNATATLSQGSFPVTAVSDNLYPGNDAAGVGWADDNGGTLGNTAVFETNSDLNVGVGIPNTLRFNLFHGGFGQHTIGNYRLSYTTDARTNFADGLVNGGDVTANWVVINPSSVVSSGGATLTIQPDGRVLASGTNPNIVTDTVYATFTPNSLPQGITGFRLEALEDPSFPTNGPGRSANGNFVAREFDVASFSGTRVALQNGTARLSQGGFSVDNMIDGAMPFTSAGGEGWATDSGGTASNVATFEAVTKLPAQIGTKLTIEILSGGFGQHTLGNFRISATTADPSLFADGNDNGGAGVGAEPIWTVLDPIAYSSDNASTTFSEDVNNFVTASGTSAEFEHYTLTFLTSLAGITGFRLETPDIVGSGLPTNGPGRAANGNFVIREFSVFAVALPEPASVAMWTVLGLVVAGVFYRRRQLAKPVSA